MSQHQLARAVGIASQQIQKYEIAANRLSVSRLAEIAAVLEVPIAWFFRNLQSPVQPGALELHQRTQARMHSGAGQHRIHGPTSEAITGIGILLREQRRQRSGRFASRPVDLATLRGFPSLQQLLDAYCASEASIDLLQRQELLANVLQRRFLIVERVDRNDTLLIRAIGAGYRAFDRHWSKKSAGMRLDEQPDVDIRHVVVQWLSRRACRKASAGRRGGRDNLRDLGMAAVATLTAASCCRLPPPTDDSWC